MNKKPLFRSRRRTFAFLLFVVLSLAIFVVVYAFVDNSRVVLDRQTVTVPSLPTSLEGATVLLISDLHGMRFGGEQDSIDMAVSSNRVDVIVFAGDMLTPEGGDEAFLELIGALSDRKKPMFFISGDEDLPTDEQASATSWTYAPWIKRAQEAGAVFLDAPQKVKIGSGTLWVMNGLTRATDATDTRVQLESRVASLLREGSGGLENRALDVSRTRLKLDAAARTEAALAEITPSDVQIGVVHNPLTEDFVRDLTRRSAPAVSGVNPVEGFASTDVLLAGHYCGGGTRLPLLGAVHVPAPRLPEEGWWPRQEQVWGNATVGGIQQVITRGLGVSALQKPLRARLFNTPAVTLVRLTARWEQ